MPVVARLYLRGRVWWTWVRDEHGAPRYVSTGCRDKKAAAARAVELERQSVDPAHRAADETTVAQALERLVAARKRDGRAEGTLRMYDAKGRHVVRILGANTPLRTAATAKEVDRFIDVRLGEGASRNTIAKELTALRGALRVAKRRGEWTGEIDAVMPINFAPEYKPRTRVLRTGEELQRLCANLPPDRAAHVCLIVAFGLRDSEAHRLRREDFDRAGAFVRGTKTEASHARVSIVADFQSVLLDVALASLPRTGPLLRRWPNIRRDLHAACAAAKLGPLSPNDLRRTYATWLRVLGLPEDLVGPALRHAPGSKLAAKVYAHLGPSSLAHAMRSALPEAARSAVVVNADVPGGECGSVGRGGEADRSENAVPRDGIEPPTRGFSILFRALKNAVMPRETEPPRLRLVVGS